MAQCADLVLRHPGVAAAGAFLTRATLQPYFEKGVPQVVVSAPVKDPEPVLNVVMGCNQVGGPACCC
jgi:glyceraldehyde-3-phosphate dehydrogenase/erythrose-4-phosphate dehydrogenase